MIFSIKTSQVSRTQFTVTLRVVARLFRPYPRDRKLSLNNFYGTHRDECQKAHTASLQCANFCSLSSSSLSSSLSLPLTRSFVPLAHSFVPVSEYSQHTHEQNAKSVTHSQHPMAMMLRIVCEHSLLWCRMSTAFRIKQMPK